MCVLKDNLIVDQHAHDSVYLEMNTFPESIYLEVQRDLFCVIR